MADEGVVVTAGEEAGADIAAVSAGLAAEIAAMFGPRDERPLAVLARDRDGTAVGGLSGATHWGWGYIRQLWVVPGSRNRGIGGRLVAEAAAVAAARGCVGLYVDTFEPRAVAFYLRNGFTVAGLIDGFPPGHARTFLAKRLDPATAPR